MKELTVSRLLQWKHFSSLFVVEDPQMVKLFFFVLAASKKEAWKRFQEAFAERVRPPKPPLNVTWIRRYDSLTQYREHQLQKLLRLEVK